MRPPGTGTALRCLVSRKPRAQPWADARSEGGGRGLRAPGPGPRGPVCVADEARPGAPARARLHVQACVYGDGRAARGQCPSRGSPVPSSTGHGSGPLRLGRWPRPPGHASPPIPGHLRGCAPTSEGPWLRKTQSKPRVGFWAWEESRPPRWRGGEECANSTALSRSCPQTRAPRPGGPWAAGLGELERRCLGPGPAVARGGGGSPVGTGTSEMASAGAMGAHLRSRPGPPAPRPSTLFSCPPQRQRRRRRGRAGRRAGRRAQRPAGHAARHVAGGVPRGRRVGPGRLQDLREPEGAGGRHPSGHGKTVPALGWSHSTRGRGRLRTAPGCGGDEGAARGGCADGCWVPGCPGGRPRARRASPVP